MQFSDHLAIDHRSGLGGISTLFRRICTRIRVVHPTMESIDLAPGRINLTHKGVNLLLQISHAFGAFHQMGELMNQKCQQNL